MRSLVSRDSMVSKNVAYVYALVSSVAARVAMKAERAKMRKTRRVAPSMSKGSKER